MGPFVADVALQNAFVVIRQGHLVCATHFVYSFCSEREVIVAVFGTLGVRPGDIPQKNKGGDHGFRQSAREFFKELSLHQVMRLYQRFFFDFEMFGYDFRDYLH